MIWVLIRKDLVNLGFALKIVLFWELRNRFVIWVWLIKAFGDLGFAQKRLLQFVFLSKESFVIWVQLTREFCDLDSAQGSFRVWD